MKLTKNKILVPMILMTIFSIIAIIFKPYSRIPTKDKAENYAEDEEPWIEYLIDSTYKVVVDTIVTIYKVHTGEKLSSLPVYSRTIRSLAMPPSGSHLLILDEYNLYSYNLLEDDQANTDTTTVLSDEITGIDCYDQDCIEFSSDGKYLMVIDYGNQTVAIYKWPGLEHLDTGIIGYYKNFWWKNISGKLSFYYVMFGYKEYIYQMVFPADSLSDTLRFSEPVCIDSIELKAEE